MNDDMLHIKHDNITQTLYENMNGYIFTRVHVGYVYTTLCVRTNVYT